MRPFWYQGLTGGMNQAIDPALIENNESPLMKNVILDQAGNWASRLGTDKVGTTAANAGAVYGLGVYNSTAGTHTLFKVASRDLWKYTEGTGTWATTDTDEWPATTKVNMINFLDRLYLGSADGATALSYVTATGVLTDIVPLIGGSKLGVNKSILAVGGNSIRPNIIFYTDAYTDTFYSATGTCAADADTAGTGTVTATTSIFEADMIGAILYNTTDSAMALITGFTSATVVQTNGDTSGWNNDTIYVLQNIFTQDGACTGLIGFQENMVSFDEDNMYLWDPINQWTQKLPEYGCVNERSIQVVDGKLVWADRDGIYMFDGEGRPTDISQKIKDEVDLNGVWNLINDSNWGVIASGSLDGRYYLSVGTLSTKSGAPASAIANVEIVIDIRRGTIVINSREDAPTCYTTFINSSGAKDLYYGETTSDVVYKANVGTTDDEDDGSTNTIAVDVRTPHYNFADPKAEWRPDAFYVKYKSSSTVTVKQSVDRGTYATLGTLPASSTITIKKIRPIANTQGFTLGLSFETTGTLVIEAYGFDLNKIEFGEAPI